MHFGTGMSVVCVKRSFRELQFFSCLVDVFVDLTVRLVLFAVDVTCLVREGLGPSWTGPNFQVDRFQL